jgi:hypothetical protein
LTCGHSTAMTEKMALSRSLPSSPGAQDGPQLRRTPSKRAPRRSMAWRDGWLRASVLKSTRATFRVSNAYVIKSSFDSALIPVRCADAASHVPPISTADRSPRPGHARGLQYVVHPTGAPSATRTCAKGVTPSLVSWAFTYAAVPAALGTIV